MENTFSNIPIFISFVNLIHLRKYYVFFSIIASFAYIHPFSPIAIQTNAKGQSAYREKRPSGKKPAMQTV